MDRREFLKGSLAGLGAAAAWSASGPAFGGRQEAVLKLCSQEGLIPGKGLKEKVEFMEKVGGAGIEFHGNPKGRVKEIQDALAGTKIKPAALCWGSDKGNLVSPDPETRRKGIEGLKSALETAGELGSPGVIFVPCFHKQSDLKPEELDKVMLEILPGLAEHAAKNKTNVLLEPLCKRETFYINLVSHAARLCKEVNKPGCALMGDFYHVGRAVEDKLAASDQEEFASGKGFIRHVHLATVKSRILPSQEERSFVDGFTGLKKIGYQDFCSLECGFKKGTNKEEEIPKAFDFLRRQWEEAKA